MLKETNEQVKNKLSCFQGISRKWVLFMNGLVLVGGLGVLGISIFNAAAQGDVLGAIGEAGVVGPIVSGVILVFISVLGCCGILRRKKVLLFFYFLVAFVLSIAFLTVGVLLTFTVDDLNNIDGLNSDTLSDAVESRLNDFLIATFNKCCTDQFGGIDRLLACTDPGANLAACFTFEQTYIDALDRVETTQFCEVLENVEIADNVVVGDPEDGGCAAGDGVLFKAVITDFIETVLIPVGALFITFAALLMVTVTATCIVLCANQDEYFNEEEEVAAKALKEVVDTGVIEKNAEVETEQSAVSPPTVQIIDSEMENPRHSEKRYSF